MTKSETRAGLPSCPKCGKPTRIRKVPLKGKRALYDVLCDFCVLYLGPAPRNRRAGDAR